MAKRATGAVLKFRPIDMAQVATERADEEANLAAIVSKAKNVGTVAALPRINDAS